jgi:hypothetical protein
LSSSTGTVQAKCTSSQQGQFKLNAHHHSTPSGWAEIIHPFHPLQGQRFRILKTRRVSGTDTLILQGTSLGSFAVPLEWTDHQSSHTYRRHRKKAPVLNYQCLWQLSQLIQQIETRGKKKVDNEKKRCKIRPV